MTSQFEPAGQQGGASVGIIADRLEQIGIVLPPPPQPIANYVPLVQAGNLIFTSGNGCRKDGKQMYEGKVGREVTIEQGQAAARQSVINILAALQAHLGDLDRITRIVKLLGFVNSAPGFTEQPYVIDGASNLLVEVFGEAGKHARSAVAAPELPFSIPVEIEMIVQVEA